ncbi:MAG: TerB family tellurite resistance protein [Cyclobacteriaceae bacterium]|nr:TerB family tellurite resistance protein [Cytophagales bacterium]MBX2898887.1 TerB family tellurite resistance protein [Cyclobacteriaceae bacterium]
MVIHKTFSDFVLYLYLHIGYADGELHPEEKRVILEKMNRHFPIEGDHPVRMEQLASDYLKIEKGKHHQIIKASFLHFDHIKFAQRYKIYADMYDIIHADGKVLESETKAVNELKEIIDLLNK